MAQERALLLLLHHCGRRRHQVRQEIEHHIVRAEAIELAARAGVELR
jgi:hypothetical protein